MEQTQIKLGLLGAAGRMGQAVQAAADGLADIMVVAAVDKGDPVRPVFEAADVVIDFTPPGHTAAHVAFAAEAGTAYVVGTTGLSDADQAALDAAGKTIAIVQAGNFSLGVNMLMALVEKAAASLPASFDIEVLEMHHRAKVDAPSGTATMLGEAAASGRAVQLKDVARRARDGVIGARPEGEIGFATLRGGAVIGEHSVIFAGDSERLELSHKAENRGLFADGALVAARFAARAQPARYSMVDVLGLGDL